MTRKNTQDEILGSPDKLATHTYGINGILASLFRTIMAEFKVGHVRWGQCMHRYLNDPKNKIPETRKDQTSMRGNIAKELLNDGMTFKVFCKGLVFLQFYRVRFLVEITDPRTGKITTCAVPVNFGGADEEMSSAPEEPPNERASTQTQQSLPATRTGTAREDTNEL